MEALSLNTTNRLGVLIEIRSCLQRIVITRALCAMPDYPLGGSRCPPKGPTRFRGPVKTIFLSISILFTNSRDKSQYECYIALYVQ